MKKEIKYKILAELRNPDNVQIRQDLARTVDGKVCYCAEGVILKALGGSPAPFGTKVGDGIIVPEETFIMPDGTIVAGYLQDTEARRLGLPGTYLKYEGLEQAIWELNDDGLTLPQIADLIEAQW